MPQGSKIYGYASLGLISATILIGIMTFCHLERYITHTSIDITNLQQVEFSSSLNKNML
jgi:hypothetical protein